MINCLHGSSTSEAANREIEMFFPVQKTVGLIKPGYSEEIVRQVIIAAKKAKFSIIASKTMTLSELQVDKMYDAHQFMPWFKNFKSYMCQSGPCFVLVMLREDAVAAWRQLIGPTDPKQAIAEAPQSLRARFGTDIMRNCLHGASHPVKANETIRELFGTDRNSGPGASTNDDHGNTIVGNKRSGGNEVTTMGNAAGVNEISINSTSVGAAMPGDKLDFVSLKGLKENYLEVAEVEKQAKSLVSAMKAERTYGEHNSDNTGKPIDQCIYEVIIYTYYRQGSKEPPNVYIILEGQNGAVTPRILLNCPLSGQYPFLTGAVDKFRIYGPDVGPIRQIMLCRNTQLTNSTNIGNVEQMIPLTQLPCFPSYWYVKIIEIIHVPTQACYVVDVDSLIGGECFDSKNLKTSSNTTNLIGSNDSDAAGGAAGSNAAGGTQASNSIGNRTSILRSTTNKNENECVYLSSVIATSAQVAAPVTESEMDMIERESINSMPGPPVKELSITEHKGILILVQTSGERKYSGTKSAARLTLLDGNKRKHVVSLEQSINSNPSPLERGQRSYFAVDLKDIRHLGKIDRIIIGQKQVRSAPAWFIDFIAIFDCRSGIDEEIYFPVYRWLDERYADRKTEITLYKNQPNSDYDYKIIDQIAKESAMKIEVITCTGWAFADAGTNASIRFVLFAGQGESTAVLDTFLEIAENNAQPFEVGSVDIFRFYIDKGSKEAVSSFQLSVEDETSDVGWFLEAIYLRINDNEEYKISVYRWLDSEAKGGNKITVNLKDYQEEFIPEDLLTYDQLYPEVPKLRLLNDLVPRKTTYLLTIHTIKRIPTTVRPSRFFAEIIGDRPAFGPEDQLRYQTSGPMELLINLEQGVLATQSISEFTLAGKPVDHPAKLRLSMRSCVKHLKDVVPLENWTIGNVLCKIGELEILFRFNQTIDPSVIRFTDAKALINF
ncbi:hypothetical protein GJ496_009677 [Pomphorhynchus laevis]|nr:hypothetical protein GJ496_009677 [Pomphorhynchus laevis]